ncbi:MAG: hypothetical protein HY400_06315 [Elusimicrobia bacterium]|nr:hypothetical protein [Elusimicrobiota bacterium]
MKHGNKYPWETFGTVLALSFFLAPDLHAFRPTQSSAFPPPILPTNTGVSQFNLTRYARFPLPTESLQPPSIQQAFINWIIQNPSFLGGLRPENLTAIYTHFIPGKQGVPDTFYIHLLQNQKIQNSDEPLPVRGTHVNATIQVEKNQAKVTSIDVQLFPSMSLSSQIRLDATEVIRKASVHLQSMGSMPQAPRELVQSATTRSIRYIGDKWRVVEEMSFKESVYRTAVDLDTGETFGWDDRLYFGDSTSAEPEAAVSGKVTGNGLVYKDKKDTIEQLVLSDLAVKVGDDTLSTDLEGQFSKTSQVPLPIEAKLNGKYSAVNSKSSPNLQIKETISPGESKNIVFNPEADDEKSTSQTTAFYWTNTTRNFLVKNGVPPEPLNRAIPTNVNLNSSCNAYYTPWNPSINFFSSSEECRNTARPDVDAHEYGHFVDDMFGGIKNGGLSEGWGDIFSMYILGIPELGLGFFKKSDRVIRHGENDYKYKEGDEVHAQGQAWMGFAWKLRQNLIAALGAETGIAKAIALVVPVIVSNATDIPKAIAQVVLRDRDEKGNYPDWKALESAAAAHGIKIERPNKFRRLWHKLPFTKPIEEITVKIVSGQKKKTTPDTEPSRSE